MRRHIIATLLAAGAAAPALAQNPDEIGALKAQIQALMARVEQLESGRPESARPARPAVADAVTGGDLPGSFKLPGSDTSISIGGYIKGQGSYSNRGPLGNPGGSDELLIPSVIPVSGTPAAAIRRDYWKESAKESRLVVRSQTPTSYGLLTTLIEADFYGTAGTETATNSNNLRLRHAWGTLGNLGFGQYWSNAANLSAVPETIDFTPQIGIFGGVRQTGLRWTQPASYGYWSVAAENPESRIVSTAGVAAGPDDDKMPDLNAKVHFKAGAGEYEAVGAFQRVNTAEAALGAAPAPAVVYKKTGWGLGFSGFIPTFGDYDRFMFGVSMTRDAGRMQSGLFGDAVLVTRGTGAAATGELRGIDTRGGFVSYRHRWTPTLRSTVAYSLLKADNPPGLTAAGVGATDKRFWTAHLNLIYSPVPQVDLGLEFLHAAREVESGQSGSLNRMLVAAKYRF